MWLSRRAVPANRNGCCLPPAPPPFLHGFVTLQVISIAEMATVGTQKGMIHLRIRLIYLLRTLCRYMPLTRGIVNHSWLYTHGNFVLKEKFAHFEHGFFERTAMAAREMKCWSIFHPVKQLSSSNDMARLDTKCKIHHLVGGVYA